MKPPALLPLLAALALPLFLPGLPAQTSPAPANPTPLILSLSFEGGTLFSLVAQIREQEPKANIIVAEGAKDIRLPAIELRGASLDAVLEAACSVVDRKRPIHVTSFRGEGEPVYSVLALPREDVDAEADQRARESRTTQVYSLSHLTGDHGLGVGFQATVILSGLETAMEDTGEAPTMRYHKESGLLIFRGTQEQQEIAATVVSALRDEIDRRAGERARRAANGEGSDAPHEKSPK